MIRNFQVWLWGIVAELEYILYPWKTKSPPNWAVKKYKLDHNIKENNNDDYENHMYYDWLLSQEQKIQRIEKNIIDIHKKLETIETNDNRI